MKSGAKVLVNGESGTFVCFEYNKHDDKVAIVVLDSMPSVQQVFAVREVTEP